MNKKLTLISLMLGVMVLVTAGFVSAVSYGPIGPDYALCNHDGGSDVVCTTQVKYDDSNYYNLDEEEELQARWDASLPTNTVVTDVEVHVLGKETDPNVEANVQLWSTNTNEELTDYQSFSYGNWETKVFQDSRLTNEVQNRISAGEDIKLELDIEGDNNNENQNEIDIDYMWLVIQYTIPDCVITIDNPLVGNYYADNISILWDLSQDCTSPTYNLHFLEGTCDPEKPTDWEEIVDSVNGVEYSWTSGFEEAEVCLRVSEDEGNDFGISGLFYIDNIDPTAEANGETCYCDGEWWMPDCEKSKCNGDCSEPSCTQGVYTCYEGDTITLDGRGSHDNGNFQSGIKTWEWSVNGLSVGEGETLEYQCLDGNMTLNVELIVTDNVGNSDTDTSTIEVINVDPYCEGITISESIVPLVNGKATIDFVALATDVSADIPLTYSWDFGDTNTLVDGSGVSHTYNTAGLYTIEVQVSDKDGGMTTCPLVEVDVRDPIQLADQEVAAFYPLEADFGLGEGDHRFHHDLSGASENCERLIGPDNLEILDQGSDEYCTVRWERAHTANPTNAERGEHFVLVKIYNNTDTMFYSFNVKVWSWMITLNEEWNLISIPLTAESSKATDVFDHNSVGEQIEQIWSYQYNSDTDESEWSCVKPTSSAGSQCGTGITKLATVEPGRSYWVKLKEGEESAIVKGMGISPNEVQGGPMLPPSIDVPTNAWSLIGRYGIVGKPYHYSNPLDQRVHGWLSENIALRSLTKFDNNLHVYSEDFTIVNKLFNNEGYWLWIEDNAMNNAEFESYAPIDKWYPENSGESILVA